VHVCFVNLWHPAVRDPEALVDADLTRRGFAEALAALGHAVTVVQEAPWSAEVRRAGVRWILVPPSNGTVAARRALAAMGVANPWVRAPADAPGPVVEALRPDVVHSFDLCFYPSLALLGRVTRRMGVPLLAHFHGGAPAHRLAWRAVERRALAGVSRAFFTTRIQAAPWIRAGLAERRIVPLPETSTDLVPLPRRAPGTSLLHLGRLDPVKDPLTTLGGFSRLLRVRPEARLTLAWNEGPLEASVRRRVAEPDLRGRVELRGRVTREEVRGLLAAADALVQASVREVCGIAVLEALAAGVPPVVSDIPAFRMLTDHGRFGRLFPVGDPVGLAHAALVVLAERPDPRPWFARALSFAALAPRLVAAYEEALADP
jgi:glycosyltransferase involved in cell wall biosynthesis